MGELGLFVLDRIPDGFELIAGRRVRAPGCAHLAHGRSSLREEGPHGIDGGGELLSRLITGRGAACARIRGEPAIIGFMCACARRLLGPGAGIEALGLRLGLCEVLLGRCSLLGRRGLLRGCGLLIDVVILRLRVLLKIHICPRDRRWRAGGAGPMMGLYPLYAFYDSRLHGRNRRACGISRSTCSLEFVCAACLLFPGPMCWGNPFTGSNQPLTNRCQKIGVKGINEC